MHDSLSKPTNSNKLSFLGQKLLYVTNEPLSKPFIFLAPHWLDVHSIDPPSHGSSPIRALSRMDHLTFRANILCTKSVLNLQAAPSILCRKMLADGNGELLARRPCHSVSSMEQISWCSGEVYNPWGWVSDAFGRCWTACTNFWGLKLSLCGYLPSYQTWLRIAPRRARLEAGDWCCVHLIRWWWCVWRSSQENWQRDHGRHATRGSVSGGFSYREYFQGF